MIHPLVSTCLGMMFSVSGILAMLMIADVIVGGVGKREMVTRRKGTMDTGGRAL